MYFFPNSAQNPAPVGALRVLRTRRQAQYHVKESKTWVRGQIFYQPLVVVLVPLGPRLSNSALALIKTHSERGSIIRWTLFHDKQKPLSDDRPKDSPAHLPQRFFLTGAHERSDRALHHWRTAVRYEETRGEGAGIEVPAQIAMSRHDVLAHLQS